MGRTLWRNPGIAKALRSTMAVDKVVYESVPNNEKDAAFLDPPQPQKPKGFGTRHTQTLILFISLTTAFTMKSQLSVLMVAMVKPPSHADGACNATEACVLNATVQHTSNTTASGWSVYRTYDWNKSTQEMITYAFFVGYTSMMVPMGIIAQKFGGKLPIMVALGVNGALCILTPWLPLIGGWVAVSVSRLLQGSTQAALFPSVHTMLGHWAPVSERGRLSTYIYSGCQLGIIIAFQVSGLFAGIPTLGWPASFWFFGSCSLICCVLLCIFGAATPYEHPSISSEELAFIMDDGSADAAPKTRVVPWKHILTSRAVWGIICAQTSCTCAFLVILTEIPLYMDNVLKVDIKNNGVLSSLPFISMYVAANAFAVISDFVANRKIMSIVNIRRTANTIGMPLGAVFILAFSFVNNAMLAISMLVISLGLCSAVYVGYQVNSIDIAPNFGGSIMAVGNMIANLVGLLIPVVVSYIVKEDVGNQGKWRIVFLILVGLQFLSNGVFVIFAKGTAQPWNFYGEEGDDLQKELDLIDGKKPAKEIEKNDVQT